MNNLTELARRLVSLKDEAERLDNLAKDNKADMIAIKSSILQIMQETGATKIAVDGRTCYLIRTLWAKTLSNKFALMEAMRAAGLDEMIYSTYHSGTLSSWVRKLDQDDQGMPAIPGELAEHLGAIEKFDVGVKR